MRDRYEERMLLLFVGAVAVLVALWLTSLPAQGEPQGCACRCGHEATRHNGTLTLEEKPLGYTFEPGGGQ